MLTLFTARQTGCTTSTVIYVGEESLSDQPEPIRRAQLGQAAQWLGAVMFDASTVVTGIGLGVHHNGPDSINNITTGNGTAGDGYTLPEIFTMAGPLGMFAGVAIHQIGQRLSANFGSSNLGESSRLYMEKIISR